MNDIIGNDENMSQIQILGNGGIGGKAKGLKFIDTFLNESMIDDEFDECEINIPKMLVLSTEVFDEFMSSNNLYDIAYMNLPDDRIAMAFQKATLPFFVLGALRKMVMETKVPLAIRSSSNLEDAKYEPFAGVYATKMTPNNQLDTDDRVNKVIEAIKYIYASTFFKGAKDYLAATSSNIEEEKMAVIIQEVVGSRHESVFFPHISGVARSYNFYPTGGAAAEDGIVSLAMGLGKTIVDGGVSWSYSPSLPRKYPPFKSIGHMLKESQLNFLGINMGKPSEYNPINETEYLVENHFLDFKDQSILKNMVSTYHPTSDKIYPGIIKGGANILTFAPVLYDSDFRLNEIIKKLLKIAAKAYNSPVEIEFAITLSADLDVASHRFGFLQVRPMVVSAETVNVANSEMKGEQVVLCSEMVLGNGIIDDITDIIFVKKETFSPQLTLTIAKEIDVINKDLQEQNKKYLLIGFGRWGTTDPWGGIPVNWYQISSARVIIEVGLSTMNYEMSQGSHFFHNLTSFGVHYYSMPYSNDINIDWDWLNSLKASKETKYIKNVTLDKPILIKTDGRNSIGVVLKG